MNKTINSRQDALLRGLLKEIRQEAGLRQQDMAERLGEPQSFVSKYESVERRLDLVELKAICDATGVSLESFVKRYEKALNEAKS